MVVAFYQHRSLKFLLSKLLFFTKINHKPHRDFSALKSFFNFDRFFANFILIQSNFLLYFCNWIRAFEKYNQHRKVRK